ncbi:hypothetical protein [Mycobacterium sp. 852002-51057_SCH5723018]|nr:hypothetical protein [Mycobacterium sp. 852002-51057_SCH5723018]
MEGTAVDAAGNSCPTYTGSAVTSTVPATIDACQLQVHPVTAG